MRNIIRTMFLVVALLSFSAGADAKKQKSEGKAELVFTETVFDFGKISENGGSVTHDFEFQNKGDAALIIFDATAECGCTHPTFPRNAIEPGKKGKISVSYNPKGRPGSFIKVVTVKSNSKKGKAYLKIKGTVGK